MARKERMIMACNAISEGRIILPTMETWRSVAAIDGYEVSNEGRVRSLTRTIEYKTRLGNTATYTRAGVILKPHLVRCGYWTIHVHGRRLTIHRLVAIAFLGDPPSPRHEVNHRDGDKLNNRVENLEWVTRTQNIRHGFATGLIPVVRGEQHAHKLTEDDVRRIRQLLAGGTRWRAIAAQFGITHWTIHAIKFGKTWRHVT